MPESEPAMGPESPDAADGSWSPDPPARTFGRRFLAGVDPSADPAAPPCGPHSLRLKLAGLPLEVNGAGDDEAEVLRRLYADHLESEPGVRERVVETDPRGDWQLRLHRARAAAFRSRDEVSAEKEFWTYWLDVVAVRTHVRVAGLGFVARIQRRERTVDVHLAPFREGGDLDGRGGAELGRDQALANALRVTVAFAALERGALLLHSAAVDRGGRAVLVLGRSGAGKSTFAGLAAELGDEVLSDELNLLWPHVPAVEQVPFAGDLGRQAHRPGRRDLVAVLPLERTGRDELPEIGWAGLWARIVGSAVFVNADPWSTDRLEELVARTLGFCDQPRGLSFTPDGELRALDEILGPPGLALGTVS